MAISDDSGLGEQGQPVTTTRPGVMSDYERAFSHGHVAGIGHAIHLLMAAGCPPEHHELLHEAIDAWERVHGNPKRVPRSRRFKAMAAPTGTTP